MLQPKVIVDYSLFEKKMGALGTKVIPRARITAQQIAKYGVKAVRLFTLKVPVARGRGGRIARTEGRRRIADMWQLTHQRRALMDLYTIKNLYPNQDVLIFFEEGTKRHEIRPKGAGRLHWTDEDTGEDVFAKQVDHPGTPATKMVERTEREVIQPRVELWMRQTFAMVDKETR